MVDDVARVGGASLNSNQVRPVAWSCENTLSMLWWHPAGRALLASQRVNCPDVMAMYWPSELERVNEW